MKHSFIAFVAGMSVAMTSMFVLQGVNAGATPGDIDTTFVPITPCRLIDTRDAPDRVGPEETFGVDDVRVLDAHGSNGDCALPADAVGLSLNVTAVSATAPTFLTVWPDGTRPKASSLNPAPGAPPTPNAVNTELATDGSFRVYNLAGAVDVIVDVNGYYSSSSLAELAAQVLTLQKAVAVALAGRSFTVSGDTVATKLSATAQGITSTSLIAPVDGQVAVVATGEAYDSQPGATIRCGLNNRLEKPLNQDMVGTQTGVDAKAGSMALSRVFNVSTGDSLAIHVMCLTNGTDSYIYSVKMAATFTPER